MGHRHSNRRRGWLPEEGTDLPDDRRRQHGERHRHDRDEHWGHWTDGGGRGRRGGPGGPGGPPAWMAGMFGLGQPERGRGPRVRRGDVRPAILDVVATAQGEEQAINGYQVIQQIAERSNGAWRPSPGSVYPTIQQLHDEGLLESDDERGRKTIRLTDAGLAHVAENPDDIAAVWAPFDRAADAERADASGGTGRGDLKPEIGQVMGAVWQIVTNGSEAQRRAAVDILVEARRQLYTVLADGPDAESAEDGDEEPEA